MDLIAQYGPSSPSQRPFLSTLSKQANNKTRSPPFPRLLGQGVCLTSKCTMTHAKLNQLDIPRDLSENTVVSKCRKEKERFSNTAAM